MKHALIVTVLIMIYATHIQAQQWTNASTYTYLTNSTYNVGIDASTPTLGKLQIGTPGAANTNQYKIVVPGIYNFEKAKFGQYANGAAGVEFINHITSTNSYGVRMLAYSDQAAGLQFQYAPSTNVENSLTYSTGMFMRASDGNIGIGTTSPAGKLQVSDGGGEEYGKYGSVQIIKSATPAENSFHLSFVRAGQMYSGFGYATGTSTFCLWMGGNTATTTPLMSFTNSQSVGIGTLDAKGYKLAVAGNMIAEKVVVKLQANWPDYVFDSSYDLRSLVDVEHYISQNKHLPDIAPAAEMQKQGLDLGDNQTKLLQKIEELTLYLIEQNKKIEGLQKEVEQLKKKN